MGCGVAPPGSRAPLPRRMMPLRAPIPSPASRLWDRSRVPVAPLAGNAALPCSRARWGLRAVAVRGRGGREGRQPLPRSPQPSPARPGRTFPALAGHGGVPGLSVRGAPPWCPGAPHCFPPEVAEDVDDTKPAPSCVLSFCCSSGYDVGGRVVWRALSHRCFKFANGCKARGGCLLGFFRFLLVGLDSRACPSPPLAPKSCVWEWN